MSMTPLRALAGTLLVLVAVACAPAAPSPTAAPAKPAEAAKPAATTAPAKPTEAAAAKPAEAKSAEAKPAASPAAKTEAKPAASPAAKTEAKPAASPAAKSETFDEKAVADFYRGKTIRLITGSAAGGGFDFYARLVARYMPPLIPGNPNVIVENRTSNIQTANAVFSTEPKDGTAIGTFAESQTYYQLIGGQGVAYDAQRFNWIGAAAKGRTACAARTDTDIRSVEQIIGGKELIIGTNAPGSNIHDIPAVMKAALGANFKLVSGYGGTSQILLALERKEIDGFCSTYDSTVRAAQEKLEGSTPFMRFISITGSKSLDEPYLKDVPATQVLAKTDEARQLLRAVESPEEMSKPYAMAPEVPRDRVLVLRKAMWEAFNKPEMKADGQKARQEVIPSTGEQVEQTVKEIMSTPPAVVEKLKEILK
jgi:tripartite-type tricarboxylate transporter receptor subunit TctC